MNGLLRKLCRLPTAARPALGAAVLVVWGLFASACDRGGPASSTEGGFPHDLGSTSLPENPERIVVLEFSFIDALASVGVAPVGIADDKRAEERILPVYGELIGDGWKSVGTRKAPRLETIAALQPDLIIADTTRHADLYELLSRIAPTLVFNSLEGDYHDSLKQMAAIGEAIGRSEDMAARLAEHRVKMEAYSERIRPYAEGVVAQFGVASAESLSLHSPASYAGSLLTLLGFSSNLAPGDDPYVEADREMLSAIDPDLLIVGEYSDPSIVDSWAGSELFDGLTAVEAGAVHNVNANNWSRLRGMVAAELAAEALLGILEADGGF